MTIRFLQLLLGAALLALLPASASAFGMRYGGGHPMQMGHPMGPPMMHQMPPPMMHQMHVMPYGAGIPRYGMRRFEPHGFERPIIERREVFERPRGYHGYSFRRYGGSGYRSYGSGGYGVGGGAIVGGAYGYSRWHHYESGPSEVIVRQQQPPIISSGCSCNCCCDRGVAVADPPVDDPPVVAHELTQGDRDFVNSVYK